MIIKGYFSRVSPQFQKKFLNRASSVVPFVANFNIQKPLVSSSFSKKLFFSISNLHLQPTILLNDKHKFFSNAQS